MKFLSLLKMKDVPTLTDWDLVDRLLKSNVKNDYILESAFYIINFKLQFDQTDESDTIIPATDDAISFIYRLLWEQMYLRRKEDSTISEIEFQPSDDDTTKDIIYISLKVSVSEAIDYIRQITPPIFRDRMIENLKSSESILSMLSFYLSDTKAHDYAYKLDMFKKCLGMYQFPTEWSYNEQRLLLIKNRFCKNPNADIIGIIDSASTPIDYYTTNEFKLSDQYASFGDKDLVKNDPTQFTVKIQHFRDNIRELTHFFNQHTVVLNTQYQPIYDTLYLSLYAPYVTTFTANKIKEWYYNYNR